jgi:hypothetical protein
MTTDIQRMIEEAIGAGFADEEISEMVYAIQDENRAMMERRAQSRAALSDKPLVLLDNEPAWDLGGRKYAVMTETGAIREITLSAFSVKPKRFK